VNPRLTQPRISPLQPSEWSDAHRGLLAPVYERGQVYNNLGTTARHPAAFDRLMAWGAHVMKSTLAVRDRELLILRTGWRCRCAYVWRQHVVIGRRDANLTLGEIDDIRRPVAATGFPAEDRRLLAAADEIFDDQFISDTTWGELSRTLSPQQLMDVVFTVGTYVMTSSLMNSLGVQLDAGFEEADPASVSSGLELE
jgi:4-carboxymuconolactone decarboxylase